jgi:hypothetical protein
MLEFLTAARFKRLDDGSIHFFPFGSKRGYELSRDAAARTAAILQIWYLLVFGVLIGAQLFLEDEAETVGVVGGTAIGLIGHYLIVYLAISGRPRSSVTFTREERRIAVLRAQPIWLLASLGLFGVSFIVVAALMYRDFQFLWPISICFVVVGVIFIAWSLRSIRRKRNFVGGA